MIKSDGEGFLVGEVVTEIKRSEKLLGLIKSDIAQIKSAILGSTKVRNQVAISPDSKLDKSPLKSGVAIPSSRMEGTSPTINTAKSNNAAEPLSKATRNRDENGRFVSANSSKNDMPKGERDDKGRFTSNDEGGSSDKTFINSLSGKIAGAISSTQGVEEADPAIKAVSEVAQPMSRGYQAIFSGGKDKKKPSWFSKIFKELKLSRVQDTVYNKASQKTLRDIEENTEGRSGVTSKKSSRTSLPSLKNVSAVLPMISKLGKNLLKKIPLISGLVAGVGSLFDVASTENNDTLTREQKDKANGKSIGGGAGSIGGMFAGAKAGALLGAFAGPLGAAVGAAIGGAAGLFFGDQAGQVLGEKLGEWTNDLRNADIPGMISSTWDDAVADFSEIWGGIKEASDKAFDWVSDKADIANDFIKEKTGIDVGDSVGKSYDYAKDNMSRSYSMISDKLGGAGDWLSKKASSIYDGSTLKKGIDVIGGSTGFQGGSISGLSAAQSSALAADTARTESGGNQRAENKYGYIGKYQFGGDALADSGLVDLERLKKAKNESGNKWFKGGQADFLNNNKNWTIEGGKEQFMGDSSLQDKAFSTYTNKNIASGVRLGGISRDASPETIGGYAKAAHLKGVGGANKLFKNGINGVDANGTSALKYANDGARAIRSVSTQSVSLPAVSAPKFSVPSKIQDAPKIENKISPSGNKKPMQVIVNNEETKQDMADRKIAMIATGGLSGNGNLIICAFVIDLQLT